MRDSRGLVYSSGLHFLFLVLLLFGLPDFFHRHAEPEPVSISVDILPIAPVSNVRPQEETPKTEVKKPEVKPTSVKPTPETKVEEKPREAPPVVIPDKPKQPEKPKPKPKPKPPEKPKPAQEDPLKAILNSVKNEAKTEIDKHPKQAQAPVETHKAKSDHYDSTQPLSMSQMDAIRSQIADKWSPPIGAKEAQNLIVTLHIELNADGTVTKVEPAGDLARYNSDSFFRAAVDSAIRAVHQASPLKNLPADKYGAWSEMEMTFDPHEML